LRTTVRSNPDVLVFPSRTGSPLNHSNMLARVLRPVAEEVGAPWAGFHTFRHTCASLLFHGGRNAVQIQRWLGHHSPAFTLSTYVHLLGDDMGEPLALGQHLDGARFGATSQQETAQVAESAVAPDLVPQSEILIQPEIPQAA
jgi:integrase